MSELHHKFIGDDSPRLKSQQVFFANLNLDIESLKASVAPIIQMICHRIEYTYKSPSKIAYVGANAFFKDKVLNCMQFDDICLRLWHVDSGLDILLILSARFARTLLIRLLATSLIDDSNAMPFSSTEKGIFSFLVARLLFDLKGALAEKMPDVKLIGIYHGQDESLADANIDGFGIYNFSVTFAADIYPVAIAVPKELFKTFKRPKPSFGHLVDRCGHIKRPLIFPFKALDISQNALRSLAFGDLVLFDHDDRVFSRQGLAGSLSGYWDNLAIAGSLIVMERTYHFSLTSHNFCSVEDSPMESVEISYAKDKEQLDADLKSRHQKLVDLTKNIRVALSIEIARLPMTLKDLCRLREGEIIDLHRKIDEPLEMVVENKVIGHCQPVQIDGRLGIRVIKMDHENTL